MKTTNNRKNRNKTMKNNSECEFEMKSTQEKDRIYRWKAETPEIAHAWVHILQRYVTYNLHILQKMYGS